METACISIKEAAEIMGKSQQFIRIGLQRGTLPIGSAVQMSSQWTYYISPKKFYEYTGIREANLESTVTRKKLLEEYLDKEKNNLLNFSTDYLMSKPKEGCSKEYFETAEKIGIIQDMISECKEAS